VRRPAQWDPHLGGGAVVVGTAACGALLQRPRLRPCIDGKATTGLPSELGQHLVARSHRAQQSTSSSPSVAQLAGRQEDLPRTRYGSRPRHRALRQTDQMTVGDNGRKINPIIASFDPTNETEMRALCKTWTEARQRPSPSWTASGTGPVTRALLTQEGHTPSSRVDHGHQLDQPRLSYSGDGRTRPPSSSVGQLGQRASDRRNRQVGVIAATGSDQLALMTISCPICAMPGSTVGQTSTQSR